MVILIGDRMKDGLMHNAAPAQSADAGVNACKCVRQSDRILLVNTDKL